MTRPTLLIPVTFPEPEIYPLTDMNVEALDGFDIVLLGYWELSEGETAAEARAAHETDAEAVLYEIAAQFSHAGASTDIQLHFGPSGHGREELQERIVGDADPDGVLFADQLSTFHNILVPLRDNRHTETVVDFVSAFDADSIFVVELYHAALEEEAVETAESMLRTVEESLLARAFSESDLEITVEVVENAKAAIAAKAGNHNLVVMGETEEPDAEDHVFGSVGSYLIDRTDTPVIVVR